MKSSDLDRFVRLPTDLLEVLLRAHLSGAQLRIVLWVLRYTFGWNRQSTPFSWYRIAKELQMPRSAVYRAGKRLAQSKVLVVQERQLTIQTDYTAWNDAVLDAGAIADRQRTTELNVAREQRHSLPASTAGVAVEQRIRCQGATLFRRAKDRCKDRKTVVVGARSVDNRNGERRIYEGADQRPTPVEQVMDHYIALQGKTLTKNQTAAFYRHFRESATTLLEAYGGDVQAAKDALTRVGRRLDGRLTIPNVTS